MLYNIFKYFSDRPVLLVFALAVFAWLLYSIRTFLAIFFLAYVIMAGFQDVVEFLRSRGMPKILAIAAPYLPVLGLVALALGLLVPEIARQLQDLVRDLPSLAESLAASAGLNPDIFSARSFFSSQLSRISDSILGLTQAVLQLFLGIAAIFVISIYMLLERDSMYKSIAGLFDRASRREVYEDLVRVEKKLGNWLRGQLVISLIVGLATWIFLAIAGVPYSGALALLAAILELIPYIGPILAAIPAILLALAGSLNQALAVAAGYTAIQQAESHFLQPNIMHKSVDLPALSIIAVVIIGGELWGVLGALLAVPVAASAKVLAQIFFRRLKP